MSETFGASIVQWYRQHGRDLPWRHTRDPYAIWLSEVILQQTRISQGRDYWLRFMRRWPTVQDIAAASEDEVLRMWQGLGYYSRARNLLAAAQQVTQMGGFPATAREIGKLKGVGPYTAAAIASLAFGQQVAVVDGNVYRVLSRHYGIETPIDSTQGKHEFAALAQALLPTGEAAAFNQGMMDLGATVCTPRGPLCANCPVVMTCAAQREHRVDQLPVKQGKTRVRKRQLTYVYLRCQGHTALRRRPAGDIWQGLWEPLLFEGAPLPRLAGTLTLLRHNVKHVLTHQELHADFYLLQCHSRPALPQGYRWIKEGDIDRYALPRLIEILLESLPPATD